MRTKVKYARNHKFQCIIHVNKITYGKPLFMIREGMFVTQCYNMINEGVTPTETTKLLCFKCNKMRLEFFPIHKARKYL